VPSNSTSNYGQIGFTNNTVSPQTSGVPTVSLTNPFPNGLVAAAGNSLGYLSGVGTTISYVDQNRAAPRVQQYSVDLQRELPAAMAITLGDVGARGDHLPLGGSNDTVVNINQLDPKYLALGTAALNQTLPNPFFGRECGSAFDAAHAHARAAAAALPAVPEHPGSPGLRGREPLQRVRRRVDEAADERRPRRTRELHLQIRSRNTRPASSTCRTGSSSRRSGSCHRRRTRAAYRTSCWRAGRPRPCSNFQSGSPFGLADARRPHIGLEARRVAERPDRHGGERGRVQPCGGRVIGINTDLSVSKSLPMSGSKSAMLKFEVINLFNRVRTNSIAITAGTSTFGQINTQSGFMRMTQVMFRFSF
jgi:hypothetical protein